MAPLVFVYGAWICLMLMIIAAELSDIAKAIREARTPPEAEK